MAYFDDIFLLKSFTDTGEGYEALAALNAGHPVFESHFPGAPIVPGVCLMRQVEQLTSKYLSKPLKLTGVSNAKFINIVSANGVGEVLFSVTVDSDSLKAKATLGSPDGTVVYARFSMSFDADSSTDTDLQ